MSAATPSTRPWLDHFQSRQAAELALDRHALIEASAGTGKTYAIEHIALRLLVEHPDWKPEEILLLSFTEKTAGELRDRIRKLLWEQFAGSNPIGGWSEEELKRIREAWQFCDDLSIHTLHGFCLSALRRDPVASRELFRAGLTGERDTAEDALETLLRKRWNRDPERLEKLRAALGMDAKDGWRDKLITLALACHVGRNDRIEPHPDTREAKRLEREAEDTAGTLLAAVRQIDQGKFPWSAYQDSFKLTNKGRPRKEEAWKEELRKDAFQKVLLAAEECSGLPGGEITKSLLASFKSQFTAASPAVKSGFLSCIPERGRELAEWKRLSEACERLRSIGPELVNARRLDQLGLKALAAEELRREMEREKIRRGTISYDDMLARLAAAMKRPGFASRLHARYRACIVDEFQDTDLLQWEILRRLCMEAPGDGRAIPLILVGDPKQAIYGFRGGDLQTYLKARAELRGLAKRDLAQGIGLHDNHRSDAGLIDGLNAVFGHKEWFGRAESPEADAAWKLPEVGNDLTFTDVTFPKSKKADSAGDPSIRLRDFSGTARLNKPAVLRELRAWIGDRILDLTEGRDGLLIPDKDNQGRHVRRKPRWKDMVVLARTHAEIEGLERSLRRRRIPCRARRQTGVYHGPDADALRLLLELIGDAGDPAAQAKILLLPFARPEDEGWPRGLPAERPGRIGFWARLADAGRWPEFFDAVLRGTGYLDRLRDAAPSRAEKLEALARGLAEYGAAPGTTTAPALCRRFDALRRGEDEESGPAVSDPDEGDDSVALMTLHGAKGLQFPVVFLAPAAEGRFADFHTLRDDEGFRHVLDKDDDEAKREYLKRMLGEDKRLFYVALTRPRQRLFIPLFPEAGGNRKYGALGRGGFAATALRDALENPEFKGIFRLDGQALDGKRKAKESGAQGAAAPAVNPDDLARATEEAFGRRRTLASYSGLARRARAATAAEEPLNDDGTRVLREERSTGGETGIPETTTHAGITAKELPPGADLGTALHEILERTDFATAGKAESSGAWLDLPGHRGLVEQRLRGAEVDVSCAPAAARAIWSTLRMPMPDPEGRTRTFRLADVADRRHEVEFLFPLGEDRVPLPEAVTRHGRFLTGFIDLVFRHEDRYYLLDWKSNLLDAYDAASVRSSMERSRYDLQWKLYSIALDKWLRARLKDYDPARDFGGVYYCYLRGAAPDRFSGFTARPTADDLRIRYPAELLSLTGASA